MGVFNELLELSKKAQRGEITREAFREQAKPRLEQAKKQLQKRRKLIKNISRKIEMKSASDIVFDAFEKIKALDPTPDEIQSYADWKEENRQEYGTVTYSEYYGGDYYFLRFHDTYRVKWGGRCHIDLGYVDEKARYGDVAVTHLMLDRWAAPEFIEFIQNRRLKGGEPG
jgi:hypothetical protein